MILHRMFLSRGTWVSIATNVVWQVFTSSEQWGQTALPVSQLEMCEDNWVFNFRWHQTRAALQIILQLTFDFLNRCLVFLQPRRWLTSVSVVEWCSTVFTVVNEKWQIFHFLYIEQCTKHFVVAWNASISQKNLTVLKISFILKANCCFVMIVYIRS